MDDNGTDPVVLRTSTTQTTIQQEAEIGYDNDDDDDNDDKEDDDKKNNK